jgi:hypothetical protein
VYALSPFPAHKAIVENTAYASTINRFISRDVALYKKDFKYNALNVDMPPLRAKKLLKCLNKLFLLPHVFLFSKKMLHLPFKSLMKIGATKE